MYLSSLCVGKSYFGANDFMPISVRVVFVLARVLGILVSYIGIGVLDVSVCVFVDY